MDKYAFVRTPFWRIQVNVSKYIWQVMNMYIYTYIYIIYGFIIHSPPLRLHILRMIERADGKCQSQPIIFELDSCAVFVMQSTKTQ